jgi:hypothetical protein
VAEFIASVPDRGRPARVDRAAVDDVERDCQPGSACSQPAWAASSSPRLVRVGFRNRAEITYLYRDGLRRFTGALVHDPTRGDQLADMVIRRGAETLVIQAKRSTADRCPHAEDGQRPPAAAFPTTVWLVAVALQTIYQEGQLSTDDTTVQEWSAATVAVSAAPTATPG